jgi:hypothetical protein
VVAASPAAAAAASSANVSELKQQLRQSIDGLDRGIFGVQVSADGPMEAECADLFGLRATRMPSRLVCICAVT